MPDNDPWYLPAPVAPVPPAAGPFPPLGPTPPQHQLRPSGAPRPATPSWQRDWLVAMICAPIVFGLLGLMWIRSAKDSPWAEAWDPRVVDMVDFVERERGLEFSNPVIVNFLDEAGMRAELEKSIATTNAEEGAPPAGPDPYLGYLRAFGLIEGEVDLRDNTDELVTELAVAFYSRRTKQVYVVFGDGGLMERSVLVHELTHALQDQNFDLGRDFDDFRAEAQLRLLTEGDARRIEQNYVESHSDAEIEAYWDDQQAESDAAYGDREDATPAITASFVSDYEMGWAVTRYLVAAGGQDALDDRFRNPNTNAMLQFDFVRYDLSDGTAGLDPETDPKTDGDVLFTDSLGPMGLFLLLSENGSPDRALVHAYEWNGDSVAISESGADEAICASAVVDMGSAEAATALVADLATWRDAVPSAGRTVSSEGATVSLAGCDPGAVDQPLSNVSLEAIALPIEVSLTTVSLVEEGVEPGVARCAALRTVGGFGLAELTGDTLTSERYWEALEANLDACPE